MEPNELLVLDDIALWSLIENVVEIPNVDETLIDIGKRILSRDLFKLVPCSSDKVNDFLSREDAYSRISNAIEQFCPGEASFYLLKDDMKFSMLNEEETFSSYLIDNFNASFVRDHESLRYLWSSPNHQTRIFTIREAVETVKSLIG